MVLPIVVQETATLAVVTLIMAAHQQMENVARTSLETRPALVPSLGRAVPFLVTVEAPVTIVLGRTVIAVLARSNAAPIMRKGGSPFIYHAQVDIPFAFEAVFAHAVSMLVLKTLIDQLHSGIFTKGSYPTYAKLLICKTDELIPCVTTGRTDPSSIFPKGFASTIRHEEDKSVIGGGKV
jgi:hypothetical protein